MPPLPALDGLRAIAILIVILSHTGLGKIVPGGFGVTIFFFLSGYLITTLLRLEAADTGRVSLRHFYFKRTLRIMPPMYLTISLVAVLSMYGLVGHDVTAPGAMADAIFLTNYAPQLGIGGGVVIPLWSLDVEEHFYILFSTLFALVLARTGTPRAAATCALLALLPLIVRGGIAATGGDLTNIFYWTHTRLDSILWGSILALWQNPAVDRAAWRPAAWQFALAVLVLGICLAVRSPVFRETVRYTLQGAALLVIFSFVLQDRSVLARALGSAPLRYVALISYTLYLAHMPAMAIAEHLGWPLPVLAGIALATIYAVIMRVVVEAPLQRLRKSHL